MTDVQRRMQRAQESLAYARHALAGGFAAEAGRAAYMATFHAAPAFTLLRTGRTPRTHSGVRTEFTRLAHGEPALGHAFAAFLGRAYELKTNADYDQAQPVGIEGAKESIAEAVRFVETIATMI